MIRIVRSDFLSRGQRCAADLYLPEAADKPPVVVMAHGFGAEKRFGLPPFAERFAQNGMAVLIFDYRGFGESEGKPRQWVSPKRHQQDWQAAIAHARSLEQVDGSRLALWGSSYSGAHVIVTAARTVGISAIVAQVPHVDAFATLKHIGYGHVVRALPHLLADLFPALFGFNPHYVKAVAAPPEFAAINTPDALAGYQALIPEGEVWENRVPARSLLSFAFYRPIQTADKVECPALIMPGEADTLIPVDAVVRTASRMKNATLVRYPIGHFDIYRGEYFAIAVSAQIGFLKQHLGL